MTHPDDKASICGRILSALPSWFGIEASIATYLTQVREMPFYVALAGQQPIGFVALKIHNAYAVEICVMGVLAAYHHQGIGRRLIAECESYCFNNQVAFLTVKTLDESHTSPHYEKTRLFYLAMGFKPLEVFPLLWGKENPCLLMVKHLTF